MADTTPHVKVFFDDNGTVTEVSAAKPLPTTGSGSGSGSGGGVSAKGSKAVTTPTIANTSTLLLAANANRISATITHPTTATQTLYIGVSGVTTSSYVVGLAPGDTYVDDATNDAWYGLMGSGSQAVSVTEVQGTTASVRGSKVITTPTIAATSTLLLAANTARITAIITNHLTATQALDIGVSGVTTSSYAVSLEPGDTYVDDNSIDAWYGVMQSGSQAVSVTEVS